MQEYFSGRSSKISAVFVGLLVSLWCGNLLAELSVENGRIMELLPGQKVTSGYMEIVNLGDQAETITSVQSEAFGRIEFHRTVEVDGMMSMHRVEEIRIAPDERVLLEPGGLHMMLMMPSGQIEVDDTVEIELQSSVASTKASVRVISYLSE